MESLWDYMLYEIWFSYNKNKVPLGQPFLIESLETNLQVRYTGPKSQNAMYAKIFNFQPINNAEKCLFHIKKSVPELGCFFILWSVQGVILPLQHDSCPRLWVVWIRLHPWHAWGDYVLDSRSLGLKLKHKTNKKTGTLFVSTIMTM